MASTTTRPSPTSTTSPSLTSTRTTNPGIGALTTPPATTLRPCPVRASICFDPLANRTQSPTTGVELLAGNRPRLFAQQQMQQGRAGDRRGVRFEPLAIDRNGTAVDIDDVGVRTDRDVVSHQCLSVG